MIFLKNLFDSEIIVQLVRFWEIPGIVVVNLM